MRKTSLSLLTGLGVFTIGLLIAPVALAERSGTFRLQSLDLQKEAEISSRLLMQNLKHPGVTRGAVIASPSTQEPNYFYHWVRDAALVMNTVVETTALHQQTRQLIPAWLEFEKMTQLNSQKANGLGEPKFHVDGTPFLGPWGRPQNDGPAIRAWTQLRHSGRFSESVLADLNHIEKEWKNPDFDLWEESKGFHFFTRYAQMAAFLEASRVALRQEPAKAAHYGSLARQLEQSLGGFIHPRTHVVTPTLPGSRGVQKPSGLDISVILAVAYFGPVGNWSVANPYVLNTLHALEETFRGLYGVNARFAQLAPGLGRYPEDVYDGNGFQGGNPWFLATFGAAEYYCQLVDELGRRGSIKIEALNKAFYETALQEPLPAASAQIRGDSEIYWKIMAGLQRRALSFIERAFFHVGPDRHYAEQFDRESGYRRGARDLTWSYAASLRAFQRCQGTLRAFETRTRP